MPDDNGNDDDDYDDDELSHLYRSTGSVLIIWVTMYSTMRSEKS